MTKTHTLVSMRDAAAQLNIHVDTLHTWRRKGYIAAVKFPNGRFALPKSELDRILSTTESTNEGVASE